MASMTDLAIRAQLDIEKLFVASVIIHPAEAVQKCGWLDPAQLIDIGARQFWESVRSLDLNGKDGNEIIDKVGEYALSAGVLLDALERSEDLLGGSTPTMYANEIARRGYMTQVSAKMPEFIKALQARNDKAVREVIGQMGGLSASAPAELPTLDRIAIEFMERVERGNLSIPT